jgi:hypothetical protein
VRRANGLEARTLAPALDAALWRNVRRSMYLTRRRGGAGLDIEWPGTGEQMNVRSGGPTGRLRGLPGEALLYIFGRQTVAQVEVSGAGSGRDGAPRRLRNVSLRETPAGLVQTVARG